MIPLRLVRGKETAVIKGYPWVFAGDIIDSSQWRMAKKGSLVAIENHKGQRIGTGYLNPASQIACRVLTLTNEPIDAAFFKTRLQKALALRQKLIDVPYYRLVHSEADGLPGLLLDRFGDIIVAQVGTAGIDALKPLWMEALETAVAPKKIIMRYDTALSVEGLSLPSPLVGEENYVIEVHENGFIYFADLLKGQKTGWFYDQRDNHKMMAELSSGKTVLDVYAHSGGFGLLAAKTGAKEVTLVDSSALAFDLAKKAAEKNNVSAETIQGDAFEAMEKLARVGRRYDIVIADPPPFVKTKKDIAAGLKGYTKMAKLAAALVAPDGMLFAASCSHHAGRSAFQKAVLEGIEKAGRGATVAKHTGAAPDHPQHPLLPQSEYLKGILFNVK